MSSLIDELSQILPPSQLVTDPLRRLAYGTDASFYRLIPELVAIVETEAELQALLLVARRHRRPVTFRAAGTSLSGQAITDGILALLGEGFATCVTSADGGLVQAGPGMVGSEVNRRLAKFGRKIGPDPASINACKIGGIAANNASGMCCGTAQNSYQTLQGLRLILADGTLLDTEDPASLAAFRVSHAALLDELCRLGEETRADQALAARIRHKFAIKNTTGYSLNALVDYHDPIDILAHLMIGSEGTLAFIARITYRTVADDPYKASALVFFPTIEESCRAVIRIKPHPVAAAELLDRAALRSVQDKPGLPQVMRGLGADAAALLIEVRSDSRDGLQQRIDLVMAELAAITTTLPPFFSTDPDICEAYWKVRKGTFPSVGAMRRVGTTVVIEDVAFPIDKLAAATLDLQALLQSHGYSEGIIFGHALEGNLHFVFTQDFGDQAEIERYAGFMEAVATLVIDKYDGSLKAEHGTGRNMAPFVEKEWGRQATDLMRRIKALFDPETLLNPGIIINADPKAHLQHLKPLPAADPLIDRCIECGFCEPLCPSHGLTLSPRQRIVAWREISRRTAAGQSTTDIETDFAYCSLDTCAGCGLCATACPVGIDTGALTRSLRGRRQTVAARKMGHWVAGHFGLVAGMSRLALAAGHATSAVLGERTVTRLSRHAWKRGMPWPGRAALQRQGEGDPVVYVPACSGRIFGANQAGEATLPETVITLLRRAGYAPRLPENCDALCCGQMLASSGMAEPADAMAEQLLAAVAKAAADGKGGFFPVIMDASSCSTRLQALLAGRFELFDFHQFAVLALLPRLRLVKQRQPIALHINCSVRRCGSDRALRQLLAACTDRIVEADSVTCCGFAGDRGFTVPELNHHALRSLAASLPPDCRQGVSTNRTCEIGLTAESGIAYRSIAYLLEECSRPDCA